MKINIFYLAFFFIYSCTNVEDNKLTKVESVIYYKPCMFDTKIVLLNVDNNDELDVIPHFIIDNNGADKPSLLSYIKRRSIESRGEKQILKMGFNVIKEYNVSQLDGLISMIQENIVDLYPEFSGTLEIVVKYSSNGDGWLELPPPPLTVGTK